MLLNRTVLLCATVILGGCALLGGKNEQSESLETPSDSEGAINAPASPTVPDPAPSTVSVHRAEVADKTADRKVTSSPKSDAELREAKLFARIDELEEQQKRQKERMVVLERGLVTGLVPEELKDKSAAKAPAKTDDAKPTHSAPVTQASKGAPVAAAAPGAPTKVSDDAELKKRQIVAQEHFKNGRYGKSIVEYTSIGKDFGDNADQGSHVFWIGRSWAGLRDYQNARAALLEFINGHAQSPLIPRAKLELARAESRLGLKETAVKRLRDVIQSHPNEDAAEMAKMELAGMQKNL